MIDLQSFFDDELQSWELAAQNYTALQNVRTKAFDFDDCTIRVQFNPARSISSWAKLDAKSIAQRSCFLCTENRPPEQQSIDFKGKYDILLNPYPICTRHFTIASKHHEPQTIYDRLIDMLDLAEAIPDYVILYNGAGAGASAPDHMHFQAGNAEFFHLPIEQKCTGLIEKHTIISKNKNEIIDWFSDFCRQRTKNLEKEPLMNVFCRLTPEGLALTVFPRKKHRPTQFFEQGEKQILISPGAIDMSGTLIVSRIEDFEKIQKSDLEDIFHQIS